MATDDHMKVTAVGLPSGALSATFGRYELENGQHIEDVVLGYSTYGTLNEVRHPIDDAFFPPKCPLHALFFFFYRASVAVSLDARRRAASLAPLREVPFFLYRV